MSSVVLPRRHESMAGSASRYANCADEQIDVRHVLIDDLDPHPSMANGVHHVARHLTRVQCAAGDNSRIVFLRSPQRQDSVQFDVPADSVALAGWRCLGKPVSLTRSSLGHMLERVSGKTIFHIHSARHPLLLFLTYQLARRGLRYAMTIHGRYSHLYAGEGRALRTPSLAYVKVIERRILHRALFVQAVSLDEAKIIRRIAAAARVILLPNAATSGERDKLRVPAPRQGPTARFPAFGYLGRYEIGHKGLDLLLEGFSIYRRNGGVGHLTLIGSGPARELLLQMARDRNLGGAVDIHGPRFGDEKAAAFASMDYFVQASRFEGAPLGAIEAALWGLPLLVTGETGLTEHLTAHHAGTPISALSATAVAAALERAARVSPEAWVEMSRGAQAMASSFGDWEGVAERLRPLYQGL